MSAITDATARKRESVEATGLKALNLAREAFDDAGFDVSTPGAAQAGEFYHHGRRRRSRREDRSPVGSIFTITCQYVVYARKQANAASLTAGCPEYPGVHTPQEGTRL